MFVGKVLGYDLLHIQGKSQASNYSDVTSFLDYLVLLDVILIEFEGIRCRIYCVVELIDLSSASIDLSHSFYMSCLGNKHFI